MSQPNNATVFVVGDGDTVKKVRKGTKSLQVQLETFVSGEEFVAQYQLGLGILVTNLTLREMSGFQLLQYLNEHELNLPSLVLIEEADTSDVVRAMRLGAFTVLNQACSSEDLSESIRETLSLSETFHERASARHTHRKSLEQLSNREADVLTLVVEGLPNKAIANRLGVSTRTIESCRSQIHHKTKTGSLAKLVTLVNELRHPLRYF